MAPTIREPFVQLLFIIAPALSIFNSLDTRDKPTRFQFIFVFVFVFVSVFVYVFLFVQILSTTAPVLNILYSLDEWILYKVVCFWSLVLFILFHVKPGFVRVFLKVHSLTRCQWTWMGEDRCLWFR